MNVSIDIHGYLSTTLPISVLFHYQGTNINHFMSPFLEILNDNIFLNFNMCFSIPQKPHISFAQFF